MFGVGPGPKVGMLLVSRPRVCSPSFPSLETKVDVADPNPWLSWATQKWILFGYSPVGVADGRDCLLGIQNTLAMTVKAIKLASDVGKCISINLLPLFEES